MSEHKLVTERLFRTKYGEVLAALVRSVGYTRFELAEEAVQSAFQRALETWLETNLPKNPGGWLYTVARNSYLESVRRLATEERKLAQLHADTEVTSTPATALNVDQLTDASPSLDDLATMILLCCNPDLPPKAQISLTLKAVCGFSVKEIARVLGMQEEATKKTITRAKRKVAEVPDTLSTLDANRIAIRFSLILETLYAMFTEGYAASSGDTQLRREIAEEAIRLTDIFLNAAVRPTQHRGDLQALTALMLFQLARFDARTSPSGLPIRLQEQDRTQWNQGMIRVALVALAASQSSPQMTSFHIEARIAAEHATSPSFQMTNWPAILVLYDQLLLYKDTPEVRLSRIVALRYAHGWEVALAELDQQEADTVMRSFLLHAIRADLLESADQSIAAVEEWTIARRYAPTVADRAFVDQKLQALS